MSLYLRHLISSQIQLWRSTRLFRVQKLTGSLQTSLNLLIDTQVSARKLYCTIDRSLIGPDTIEGDVLVGFKNEKPKVWRVYTRKKKENSVGNMRVVSC
jgi:hypothetical protein